MGSLGSQPFEARSKRRSGRIDEDPRIDAPVFYPHPLAYLLGLEGIASLRAFSGDTTGTSLLPG